MVFAVNPVIELVYVLLPVPSVVKLLLFIVGELLVLQQTPFAVIEAPPFELIVPPDEADVSVIELTATVVMVGAVEDGEVGAGVGEFVFLQLYVKRRNSIPEKNVKPEIELFFFM